MYSVIAVQDGVKLGPWSPSSCTEYGCGDGRNGGDYQDVPGWHLYAEEASCAKFIMRDKVIMLGEVSMLDKVIMPTRSSRWSGSSRSFRRMLQRGDGS